MAWHALRRRLDRLPRSLLTRASRDGVVHATNDLQLYGVDIIATTTLNPDRDVPFELPVVDGDEGPHASNPRWHGVLPFDPHEEGVAHLPATQLCVDQGAIFATAIGDDLDELTHRLRMLENDETDSTRVWQDFPHILSLREEPSRQRYVDLVAQAIEALHDTEDLEKIVLARRVLVALSTPLDPATALHHMETRDPTCTRYCVPTNLGRLIGASPELLISLHDGVVSSHPLAGTISLAGGQRSMAALAGSAKDAEEHRLVVDDIADRLGAIIDQINVPSTPSIVELRDVAHLGTVITGRARRTHENSVALLRTIHPTPAIGGVPREKSLALIRQLERRARGAFGGAVGWSTADGDGEWVLAIRGALLKGTSVEVCAGAGIVSASDPRSEGEETRLKLASILEAVLPGSGALLSRG